MSGSPSKSDQTFMRQFSWLTAGLSVLALVLMVIAYTIYSNIPKDQDPAVAKRTEAASIFSLIRNIGSSMGISIMQGLFLRNSAAAHARLAEPIHPEAPVTKTCMALSPFGSVTGGPNDG